MLDSTHDTHWTRSHETTSHGLAGAASDRGRSVAPTKATGRGRTSRSALFRLWLSQSVLVGMLIFFCLETVGCQEDVCEAFVDKSRQQCNLIPSEDYCTFFRCPAECLADLPCDELRAIFLDDAPLPFAVSACVTHCAEQFTCADGSDDILEKWVCDGVVDCLDHSDERNCP